MGIRLERLDLPPCCSGAPSPRLFATDDLLIFGYNTPLRTGEPRTCVLVEPEGCFVHRFGAPNDEVLHGHRYASLVLEPYAAYEVLSSEWIADLKNMNRLHRNDIPDLFDQFRHYIFTFHDSMLEFIAFGELLVSEKNGTIEENFRGVPGKYNS